MVDQFYRTADYVPIDTSEKEGPVLKQAWMVSSN